MDFPIIEDSTLVDRIEHVIALTWTQRLFSWPWRPWVKTRSWFTTVPSRQMLRIGNVVHMHPEAARALRAALARQRLERAEENFYRREFVPAAPYVKRVKPQMPPHRNPAEPVPFPAQPWRVADTGREAMDSMLDATEIKIPVRFSEQRNEDGFPTPDSGSSSSGTSSWSCGDSSSSDSGSSSYGGSD